MDYRRSSFLFIGLIAAVIFFAGCTDQEKNNTTNTYYIELVNFNHDSLKKSISEKLFGKASFYKNSKLEIVSVNYITDFPDDIHFYKNVTELGNEIEPETKKVRLEFGGVFTNDSILYSLQKFVYRDRQWKKTSDMGSIKAFTNAKTNYYMIDDFSKEMLTNTVEYTYN